MSGYPPGYTDPPYDGSVEDFGHTVIPARAKAIVDELNERFPLPDGMFFEYVTDDPALD